MIRQLIFTGLFFLACITAGAQVTEDSLVEPTDLIEEVVSEEVAPPDTVLRVHPIPINSDSAREWKKRKEFSYVGKLDSMLRKVQSSGATQAAPRKTRRTSPSNSFSNRLLGGSGIKFFLWTLAIIFLIIIVFQLTKTGRIFTSGKKEAGVTEVPDEETLLLHHNFNELIQNAVNAEDYRLATRYHFLKILQQLRDKNHIMYEPGKTNSRYLREIPAQYQSAFANLVLQYEFVWYGHYDLSPVQYTSLEKIFHIFSDKI
jgi:hypothetical protein